MGEAEKQASLDDGNKPESKVSKMIRRIIGAIAILFLILVIVRAIQSKYGG